MYSAKPFCEGCSFAGLQDVNDAGLWNISIVGTWGELMLPGLPFQSHCSVRHFLLGHKSEYRYWLSFSSYLTIRATKSWQCTGRLPNTTSNCVHMVLASSSIEAVKGSSAVNSTSCLCRGGATASHVPSSLQLISFMKLPEPSKAIWGAHAGQSAVCGIVGVKILVDCCRNVPDVEDTCLAWISPARPFKQLCSCLIRISRNDQKKLTSA